MISNNSLAIQTRLAEKARNYNRWIFKIIEPFLGKRIIDIGCSIGNITRFFITAELVIGVDVDKTALEIATQRCAHLCDFRTFVLNGAGNHILALKAEDIDTIVCLNVLEHLQDDGAALHAFHEVLVSQGHLILLVPALKWLYGSMDVADNHYRRYSKRDLQAKVRKAGFEVETILYFNLLGTIGWYLNGRVLNRTILPANQLSLYDKIVPIAKRLEAVRRPPVGQSLILVARK